MSRLLIILIFGFLITSCKPSFDLVNEKPLIKSLASGNYSNSDYLNSFPNNVKDSLPKEKLLKHLDSIRKRFDSLFYTTKDLISQNIKIEKLSSTRKINGHYFKIVEYSNSIKVQKNKKNLYLSDFKEFLNQNLIKYSDNVNKLVYPLQTKLNGRILAYWEKDKKEWKYIVYDDLFNERLFGLKTTQKIIDLYFDNMFIPSKIKWNKESKTIFNEIYEEERITYTEEGIDFNKFLKCKRKYQEKAEEIFNGDIPDKYFESSQFIDGSIKCRIYSKKIN